MIKKVISIEKYRSIINKDLENSYFKDTDFPEEITKYLMINFLILFVSLCFFKAKANIFLHILFSIIAFILLLTIIAYILSKLLPLYNLFRNGRFYQFYSLEDNSLMKRVWECFSGYFISSFLIIYFSIIMYISNISLYMTTFSYYPLILFCIYSTRGLPYLGKLIKIYFYSFSPVFVIIALLSIQQYLSEIINLIDFRFDSNMIDIFSFIVSILLICLILISIYVLLVPNFIKNKRIDNAISIIKFTSEVIAVISFSITIVGKESINETFWIFVVCCAFFFSLFLILLQLVKAFFTRKNERNARKIFRKIMRENEHISLLELKKCCYYGGEYFLDLIYMKPELISRLYDNNEN